MSFRLQVECHSGHKADERPLRFSIGETREAAGTAAFPRRYEVKEILDQWYGPEYQCFKVLADDGNHYILRHNFHEEIWSLDSFRSTTK